ncbi:hypothetical protein ABQE58_26120, partial [Mycolicibacterium elephantis]
VGAGASATAALSAFTAVTAFGDNATAGAIFSFLSMATQIGPGTASAIGGPNLVISASPLGDAPANAGASGGGNIALQLGPGGASAIGIGNAALGISPWGDGAQTTVAGFIGTAALNLYSNSFAAAQGFLALAVNVLDYTLWPFQPLVDVLQWIANGIRDILQAIGVIPPPPPPEPEPEPEASTLATGDDGLEQQAVSLAARQMAATALDVDGPGGTDEQEAEELPAADAAPEENAADEATLEGTDVETDVGTEVDAAIEETDIEGVDTDTDTDTDTDSDIDTDSDMDNETDVDLDTETDTVEATKEDDDASEGVATASTGPSGTVSNQTSGNSADAGGNDPSDTRKAAA